MTSVLKNIRWGISLAALGLFLSQCTKFSEPDTLFNNKVTVTTVGLVGSPAPTAATIAGTVECQADNLAGKERGVCFSLSSSSVTIAGTRVASGAGIGTFNTNLTGLIPGRTYFYRSYLIYSNPSVVFYGDIKSFNTPANCPTLTTSNMVRVNTTTANLGGNVSSDGGAPVSTRGVLISSSNTNPTVGGTGVSQISIGTGTGGYSSNISGFVAGTRYYVRAYAINSSCTNYGNVITFIW